MLTLEVDDLAAGHTEALLEEGDHHVYIEVAAGEQIEGELPLERPGVDATVAGGEDDGACHATIIFVCLYPRGRQRHLTHVGRAQDIHAYELHDLVECFR